MSGLARTSRTELGGAAIRFLEQVFDEVCELFPGKVVHIGGDECPKKRWKACPKCQARIKTLGLKDEKDLQAWVTHHFANYLAAKGRRAMGWDEILEGEGCPTNVIVQSWRTVSSHRREGVAEPPALAAARRDLRRGALRGRPSEVTVRSDGRHGAVRGAQAGWIVVQ